MIIGLADFQVPDRPGTSSRGLVASGGPGVKMNEMKKLVGSDQDLHTTTILEADREDSPLSVKSR